MAHVNPMGVHKPEQGMPSEFIVVYSSSFGLNHILRGKVSLTVSVPLAWSSWKMACESDRKSQNPIPDSLTLAPRRCAFFPWRSSAV
mmetsp:Transcript_3998/g.15086  ORF Transcript_3998/g.15086 Transcript_3998/m.15086 type:complete len:87 (-) Transcript_3998:956-1216(-)